MENEIKTETKKKPAIHLASGYTGAPICGVRSDLKSRHIVRVTCARCLAKKGL